MLELGKVWSSLSSLSSLLRISPGPRLNQSGLSNPGRSSESLPSCSVSKPRRRLLLLLLLSVVDSSHVQSIVEYASGRRVQFPLKQRPGIGWQTKLVLLKVGLTLVTPGSGLANERRAGDASGRGLVRRDISWRFFNQQWHLPAAFSKKTG
jgi:hypothetical protein